MPIRAVITTLPSNGGSPITNIEYRINGGSAVSFGAAVPGTYSTTADIGDDVEIRAVNAIGTGPWSDVKSITAETEILANPNFDDTSVWAGTDAGTAFSIAGGNMTITNRGPDFTHGVAQAVSFAAGEVYDVSVTVVSTSGGGVRIKIADFDIPALTPLTTPGTYTAQYTSPSAATRNFIISTSQAAASVVVSSVSLKLAP